MEKNILAEVKSIQSDMRSLSVTENDVLKENLNKRSDAGLNKCIGNLFTDCNSKFEIPDDFLVEKILQQVEFLLSDANILKDKFLLKHMRRNKEGYISLKLVSSLRKVKALSKDWRIVAYSLQKSRKLQMNEEMTKIKRIDPLPLFEELDASRTVLVFHYPPGCWTSENVKKQLNKLGTVMWIITVNSMEDVMNTNVKKTLEIHENIATFPFAVVKFDTPDESANAVLQTSHPASIFKIVPLLDAENIVSENTPISSPNDVNERFSKPKDTCIFDAKLPSIELKSYPEHLNLKPCSGDNSSTFISKIKTIKQDDKSNKPKNVRQPENRFVNVSQDKGVTLPVCSYRGDGPGNNVWTHRRHFGVQHRGSRVIILRQPKGPDGTKGFRRRRISTSVI